MGRVKVGLSGSKGSFLQHSTSIPRMAAQAQKAADPKPAYAEAHGLHEPPGSGGSHPGRVPPLQQHPEGGKGGREGAMGASCRFCIGA